MGMKETSCPKCFMPYMESRNKELVCVNCGPVLPPGKETTQPKKQQVQKQESPKKTKNATPHFEQNVLEKNVETDEFYNIENSLKTIVTEKTNSSVNNQTKAKNKEKQETHQNLISKDSINLSYEKIASIELKRLSIIEREMDNILNGSSKASSTSDKMMNYNLEGSLNLLRQLQDLQKISNKKM